jgi:glycosyltransferase involved in cell wall biosynthesis
MSTTLESRTQRLPLPAAGERIKVAHIATVASSLRYLLLNQLVSLQQAGYEVTALSADGADARVVEAAGIRFLQVPLTRRFAPAADLRALGALYRVFRRERFTIVHTHTPKPGLLGQLAAWMAGVPVRVNTVHGFYFHEHMAAWKRRFYVTMERLAARCAHGILSQNREDIQTAVQYGICPPDRIQYLGNGIDVRRFDRSALRTEDLVRKRQELGLPPAAPVVGFVGRLVQEKGLLEFLQAARIIRRELPDARFLIVGPEDSVKKDAVSPQVSLAHGVAEACTFAGQREDMPELYALMDVFVLPSHREGFPRAPMEASAMGVPCVVTDVRGCREAVEHGRNGLRIPLGDVQGLAASILALLRDPFSRQGMSEEGRQLALQRFDEQLVFAKVKANYLGLLTRGGVSLPLNNALRS